MRLKLANFKCFSKATFEFPASCTLVSGVSGSGKTSILAAIYFAVTGSCKKPVSFGKTRCRVQLWYDTLEIDRTKGPDRLVVTVDNQTFEGSEAQALIDRTLPDWELGYVSQRLYKSFITTSAAEKLDVIEKMSFVGLDIDTINTKSKDLTGERKLRLQSIVSERTALELLLTEMGVADGPAATDTIGLEAKLEALRHERVQCESDVRQLQHTLQLQRDRKKRVGEINNRLLRLGTKTVQQSCIDQLQAQTDRYRSYTTALTQLNESIEYSGLRETEVNLMIEDMKLLKSINAELHRLRHSSRDLAAANAFKESHVVQVGSCPSCGVAIGSWNGQLVLPNKSSKYTTVAEAENCEHKRKLLMESVARLGQLKQQKLQIQKLYSDELNVEQQLSYLHQIKTNDRIWERCNQLECDKPTENVQQLIEQMKEQTLLTSELKKLEALTASGADETESETLLASKLETLETLDAQIESLRESIKNNVFALKWEKVKKLKAAEDAAVNKLQSAVKLAALIKTAERLALMETLENINLRVKIYTDKFFETNLTVELVFEDKLKPKIELKVVQNQKPTTIDSLSGGEFARVVLAFTLAMAEVNNLHFLMLDESFASLDADTTLRVLDAIKENFNGKVVVVAHQMVKGVFESVIEL